LSGKIYKHVVNTSSFLQASMGKLCCVDYGFECEFVAETGNDSELVEQFAKHTDEVHGIEYSEEALMQFIMRKYTSGKVEGAQMQVA